MWQRRYSVGDRGIGPGDLGRNHEDRRKGRCRSLGRGGKGKTATRAAISDATDDEDDAPAKRRAPAKKAARRATGATTAKTTARKTTSTAARKRRAA